MQLRLLETKNQSSLFDCIETLFRVFILSIVFFCCNMQVWIY